VDRLATFNEHRPLLFSMAYRMLGTRADAEDVLQEGYLRWQNAPVEEVRSPKSYLTAVVSRLALDSLKEARRKRETYMGTWLPEPVFDPRPSDPVEMAESLSIAFLHVLETLSPAERVAFLLREIFGEEYATVASILETTEANVRQLVSRARQHLADRRPRFGVDRPHHEAVLRRFIQSCATGDTSALAEMLKEDVVAYSDGGGKAKAAINPIYGLDKVTRFLLGVSSKLVTGAQGEITEVNGEPALVLRLPGSLLGVLTLDLDGDARIRGIYYVANPDKLRPS
jgi:RNA polymerase sigma-70 factor (ECF subfamily)